VTIQMLIDNIHPDCRMSLQEGKILCGFELLSVFR